MAWRSWLQALLVFLFLFLLYAGFHQSRDWNTASRLLLSASLVQDQSIEVTPYVSDGGQLIEHPLTRDLAVNDQGEYFCDKAPGHSFWGALSYALLRPTGHKPLPQPAPSNIEWQADVWITWLTNGLATAATGALILLFVHFLSSSLLAGTLASLAFGLSTIAFPYATLFYGHSTAAFWSLLSVYALTRLPRSMWGCLLAGTSAGLATVTEYTLIVLPVAIVLTEIGSAFTAKSKSRPGQRILFFVLGGLPFAILLGIYHNAVTGSPFRFPYSMEVHDELFGYHKEGYGIPIGLPDLDVAWELIFGQRRGILWYSPVLLGAIPGLWVLCRQGYARLAAIIAMTFAGLFLINVGFPTWDGGWATGTRFLLPSYPLLSVASGVWLGTGSAGWGRIPATGLKLIWCLAGLYGFLAMLGCTLAGVRFPPHLIFPLREGVLPALRDGRLVSHFGQWGSSWLGMNPSSMFSLLLVVGAPVIVASGLILLARRLESNRTTFSHGKPPGRVAK